MFMRIAYLILGLGTVALLAIEAPRGSLLTAPPARGPVSTAPDGGSNSARGATVRGYGPAFVFLGGGFRGGK